MASRLELTAVYEDVGDGWVQARLLELPAVITAARSMEEAKESLADALREYLLALAEAPAGDVVDGLREQFEVTIGN
jgi:predicted RNase H-like HicB family nuclease